MNADALGLLLACGAACAAHVVICISFLTASQLSFSAPRILAAHGLSFLAGLVVLAVTTSPRPIDVVAYALIVLPTLVGFYGVALHAHNSIAFRLLHEISTSSGLSAVELQAVHSSQELRVRRRLDELVRRRYVVLEGDLVRPTPKGLWVSARVESLRRLFGSMSAQAPSP